MEIDNDQFLPGWICGTAHCSACGAEYVCVVHPLADLGRLQCAECDCFTASVPEPDRNSEWN